VGLKYYFAHPRKNMTTRQRRTLPIRTHSVTTTEMNGQHIPPFFAMAMPTAGPMRRVWIFEAHRLNQEGSRHESIRVRPSTRFARWYNEHPGFLMEDTDASEWYDRTTFVVDRPPRHGTADRYHGGYMLPPDDWDRVREVHMRWRFSGATVSSMLCPDPIPILNMEHPEYLPITMINEMRIVPCTRIIHRTWRQRWDPEFVAREIENLQAAVDTRRQRRVRERTPSPPRPIAGDGGVAAGSAGLPTPPAPQPLPKVVADALIRDAVAAAATCPITMEPITAATAAVTSCFHVFDANAIAIWMVDHQTCPTCKTRAVV
jgi:hypothetical protein